METEVPIQFFQSVIAIELAVTGALLFQINYFSSRVGTRRDERLPSAMLRLAVAVVLGAGGQVAALSGFDRGRSA